MAVLPRAPAADSRVLARRAWRPTGLLLGGLAGAAAFAIRYRKPLLPLAAQRLAFAVLLACCLTIPSNWTQDVPGTLRRPHAGLEDTWLYPEIDTAPP